MMNDSASIDQDSRLARIGPPIAAPDVGTSASQEPVRPTRLLLICHGEGIDARYSGLTANESGLTATGWEQASALAEWLHTHEELDVLISSSQLRSRLTAQRIGQESNLSVAVRSQLPATVSYDWTTPPGSQSQQIADDTLNQTAETATADPTPEEEASVPEADAYTRFCSLAVESVNTILREDWGQTIAIATNANTIAALIRQFFGCHTLSVRVDYAGLSEIMYDNQHWSLRYVNRREHLPRPPLTTARVASTAEPAADTEEMLDTVRRIYDRVAASFASDDYQSNSEAVAKLIEFAQFSPQLRILEVGSGPGHVTLGLAQHGAGEVVGVDISPAMLEQAEYLRLSSTDSAIARRISYRLAPAHALPFGNHSFDAAVCRFLIHLLKKPPVVLQEIRRVLKPGGELVVVDLLGNEDAVKRATQNAIEERRNPGHRAARSAQQYRQMLADTGFVIEDEKIVSVERELHEWMAAMAADEATEDAVQEMLEASMETDAAGLNVRRQGETIVFDQHMIYLKATKAE